MSGFSSQWLALREPVDHRARANELAGAVHQRFAHRAEVTVTDLGCGTGSNLRATALLLGPRQRWTLVDYDAGLLDAAKAALTAWADHAEPCVKGLFLTKGVREIDVSFEVADLAADLATALAAPADLVTAAALFDLVSAPFLDRFADALAKKRCAFYTVLTYNGIQQWTPQHPADAAMLAAFHAHQVRDKGFGAAAGPRSASALAAALQRAGLTVSEGDSPWRLEAADGALIAELASGYADAVAEMGMVTAADIAAWRKVTRTRAVVGHTDTFAVPPA